MSVLPRNVAKTPQHLVTLYEAGEELDLNPCTFYNSENRKYEDFIHVIGGKKYFDIRGYKDFEDLKVELLEKTKLFTEYLAHEEGVTYTSIAKSVGITFQVLSKVNYGFDSALKICRWYKKNDPSAIERFDKYYGWSK